MLPMSSPPPPPMERKTKGVLSARVFEIVPLQIHSTLIQHIAESSTRALLQSIRRASSCRGFASAANIIRVRRKL